MTKNWIIETIAFITILLFLYTGINKLVDFAVFREQIAMSPVLQPVAGIVAWVLPLMEFTTAILLFFPAWRVIGFWSALLLMLSFTAYVGIILMVDKTLPCSCGGIISSLSWQQHLVVNSLLVVMEFTGLRLQKLATAQRKLAIHSA